MTDLFEVKQKVEDSLLKMKGVVGVGLASMSPERLTIYVENQETAKKIPLVLLGTETRTIITRVPKFQIERNKKTRPALPGISIGHKSTTAGTFGFVVLDKNTKQRLILTNNHVAANFNRAALEDHIYQPGPFDGGTEDDTIGILLKYREVTSDNNLIDGAVVRPDNDSDIFDEILGIGKVSGAEEARPEMTLRKSGRTSGITGGTVLDINATIAIDGAPFGRTVFRDQIVTTAMAFPGDSGSVSVSENNRAVGLISAGSDTITIHNKIRNVARLLNVDIIGDIDIDMPQAAFPTIPVAAAIGLGLLVM